MASGSSQASSMTSRMRETGMEPAIEEANVGISPDRVVISSGGNRLPPLCAPGHRPAGPAHIPRFRTKVALALESLSSVHPRYPRGTTKGALDALIALTISQGC